MAGVRGVESLKIEIQDRGQTGSRESAPPSSASRVPSKIQERMRGCSTHMNEYRRARKPGCPVVESLTFWGRGVVIFTQSIIN